MSSVIVAFAEEKFSDSFTMIVGTSKEREVCGSDVGLGGIALSVGGGGNWTRICFGRYYNLGQSEAGRESGAPLTG